MVLIIAIIPAAAAAAASVGRQVICTKAAQKTERQIVASVVMKLANTGGSAVAAAVATEIGGVTVTAVTTGTGTVTGLVELQTVGERASIARGAVICADQAAAAARAAWEWLVLRPSPRSPAGMVSVGLLTYLLTCLLACLLLQLHGALCSTYHARLVMRWRRDCASYLVRAVDQLGRRCQHAHCWFGHPDGKDSDV